MRFIGLIIISCFCFQSFAQESEVSFIIKNFGINVDGHFNRYKIEISQEPEGEISKISGVVYVNTIETGIDSRDEHLLGEDYFDALKHPEISLESTSVLPLNNAQYKIMANLNIKGIIKPLSLKGSLLEDSLGTRFQTEFEINRRDFNVGGGGVLGKVVKVKVIYYLEP